MVGSVASDEDAADARDRDRRRDWWDDGTGRIGSFIQQHPRGGGLGGGGGEPGPESAHGGTAGGFSAFHRSNWPPLLRRGPVMTAGTSLAPSPRGALIGERWGPRAADLGRSNLVGTTLSGRWYSSSGRRPREKDIARVAVRETARVGTPRPLPRARSACRLIWQSATRGTDAGRKARVQTKTPACVMWRTSTVCS